jgi:glycerophosphoryl diester phosphodiesterase
VPARLSKATRIWLAVTAVLAGLTLIGYLVSPGGTARKQTMPSSFDLQGHRGARGLHPENSLPGFEGAIALGVTTLEMDVGMTRDGVLVVHHDRRLDPDRTRGPDGAWLEGPGPALVELDFEDLQGYDVGRLRPDSKYARRFPEQAGLDGVTVPPLEAVLARVEALSGGTMRYNIETKISPLAPGESPTPEDLAAALVAAIGTAGVAGRTTVQSFDWRTLKEVQDLAPGIATAYLTAEQNWLDNIERGKPGTSPWTAGLDVDAFEGSVPRLIEQAGGQVWSPYYRDLREADLREARRLGLKVVPYTVNDPADMAALIERGIDGIITDYPDRLRGVMAEKGLALPPSFSAGGG